MSILPSIHPPDCRAVPFAQRVGVRQCIAARLAVGLALFLCAPVFATVPTSPYHPERILVMPRRDRAVADLMEDHAAHGRLVLRVFPGLGGLQVVRLAAGEEVGRAVAGFRSSDQVAWAEPDFRVSAAAVLPGDPLFQNGTQWSLNNYGQQGGAPDADVDAPEAWDVLRTASNVVVAIVDSGVRATHEDLADNLWCNPLDGTPGFNAFTEQHDPWDEYGHGTHLAGIIGALTDNGRGVAGVAWRVQLMICKFLDEDGYGYHSGAVACLEFARSHGAHILNLSWGGTEFSASVSNALWAARADGLLVSAAAGNKNVNTDFTPFYPASLPLDNVVAVAASTRHDTRWSLSDYGAVSVDLFAPGADIHSTAAGSDAAYETRHGSSMAAAFVTGALALLRQAHPDMSGAELIGRLLASVDARPAFAGKCVTGGCLNLRKALDLPSLKMSSRVLPAQVSLRGVAGHTYVVSASTNLTTWAPTATNTLAATGEWVFEDALSTNLPGRFYRGHPGP